MPLFWMTTSAMRVSPAAIEKLRQAERGDEGWIGGGRRSPFRRAKMSTLKTPLPSGAVLEEGGELFGLLVVFVVLRG